MKNNNTIPAVDKTLKIMEYLASEQHSATQAELCKAADVTATTGYRIVQTLIKHDWVRKTPDNRYMLSFAMLDIWMKSSGHRIFFEQFQPVLDVLAEKVHLSCKLSIRGGNEQISILRADSPEPFSISGKIGTRFPLIEGSVGAALLALDPEEDIRALCEECQVDIREKNNSALVLSRIREWKKKGYVFNRGTNRWHVDAMSVPVIRKGSNVVAALTLIGVPGDFTEKNMEQRAESLTEAAKQIGSQI